MAPSKLCITPQTHAGRSSGFSSIFRIVCKKECSHETSGCIRSRMPTLDCERSTSAARGTPSASCIFWRGRFVGSRCSPPLHTFCRRTTARSIHRAGQVPRSEAWVGPQAVDNMLHPNHKLALFFFVRGMQDRCKFDTDVLTA